jgi:hypothetical protein
MDVGTVFAVVLPVAGVNKRLLVKLMVRLAGLLVVPAGTVITTGDHFGGAVAGSTDTGFSAAHVAVDPVTAEPQK